MDGVAPGMASALVGEGARLGNQECGPCSSAPCTMNDDAGSPPERNRTTGIPTGTRNRHDVDSFIGRDRTTGFSAEPRNQGDVDSFIKRDRLRDPAQGLRIGVM